MKNHPPLASVVALALAGLLGCAPDDAAPGARTAAVIDGAPETMRPGVVALVRPFGGQQLPFCSGTVIGPYAVLTAKHCVDDVVPSEVSIAKGSDVSGGILRDTVPALEIRSTPGPVDLRDGNDVAIVLLARDVEAPAHEVATAPPSVGDPITIVGYGRINQGTYQLTDFGRKHSGTANVSYVDPGIFLTRGGSSGCHGDSGGAGLDARERVIGVTSFVTSTLCDNRETGLANVSLHAAMIADALAFVPPCIPETERCNDVDDDCNGIVDDGCGEQGEPCTVDEECASARCESVEGAMLCTAPCDPTERDGCDPGLACEADACAAGRCVPAGTGAPGDPCSAHADCASARCVAVSGAMRCGEACVSEGPACPDGLVCEAPDGACGACVPDALAPSPRLFGDPCDDDARCASGLCELGRCTRACGEGAPCPDGAHCRAAICVPGPLGDAGDRCQTDEDCAGALRCAAPDQLCAAPCNDLGRCPVGFACDADLCLPSGAALGAPCADAAECRSDRCEAGACTRACSEVDPCAAGFACESAGAGESLCVLAPASGGCASAGGDPEGAGWALAAMMLLFAWRRRGR